MSARTHRMAVCALLLGAALPSSALAQWSTDSLSVSRHSLALVSSGGKAFFAGGRNPAGVSDRIDIFDEATDTWSQATLSVARSHMAAAAVGPYVLFTGGLEATASDVVDVYDAGLGRRPQHSGLQ
jgi:hypothetical protein